MKNRGLTLLELLRSLAEAPVRTCRSQHDCCLCERPIVAGEKYADRGFGGRAHGTCLDDRARKLCGNGLHGGGRVCPLPAGHKGACYFECGHPNLDDYFPLEVPAWTE